MQTTTQASTPTPISQASPLAAKEATPATSAFSQHQILRRNGAMVPFEPQKISVALMMVLLAVRGAQGATSASIRKAVGQLTQNVTRALLRSRPSGGTFPIEDVRDQVELGLMRGEHHYVARAYVIYHEQHAQERAPRYHH